MIIEILFGIGLILYSILRLQQLPDKYILLILAAGFTTYYVVEEVRYYLENRPVKPKKKRKKGNERFRRILLFFLFELIAGIMLAVIYVNMGTLPTTAVIITMVLAGLFSIVW